MAIQSVCGQNIVPPPTAETPPSACCRRRRRRLAGPPAAVPGIRPEAGQARCSALPAQQRDRIAQIGIQQRDGARSSRHRGIAHQRGAQHAKAKPPSPLRRPAGRSATAASSRRAASACGRDKMIARVCSQRSWPVQQRIEQAQLNAGLQNLAVDKAGAQVEQAPAPGAAPSAGSAESGCPALKARAGKQPVARSREPARPGTARLIAVAPHASASGRALRQILRQQPPRLTQGQRVQRGGARAGRD